MKNPRAGLALVICLSAPVHSEPSIDTIEVVGRTPLGAELDAERIPSNVQKAVSEEIREQHTLDLADFMKRNLASVFVNEAQGNPLQPDVQYRGFVASPLLGLPQGIAVYQDGVRINEPFGDTVNWALIPESAIEAVYLMPGSNPLFGLNALGGAIAIETRDGFSSPGTSVEILGGSFSRIAVQAETGDSFDERFGYFVTGSFLDEAGWRDFSPTEAVQFFGNVGWRSERTAVDLAVTLADTELIGNGAAPVGLLDIDRASVFTRPDRTENRLGLLTLNVEHDISDSFAVAGNLYVRGSDIGSYNGDDSDYEECAREPGFICAGEGDGPEQPVVDGDGKPIRAGDDVEGATVNRTQTDQDGAGSALQMSWTGALWGHDSYLVLGVAYDRSRIGFAASTELGHLDETRLAVPGGVLVGESLTHLAAETANAGLYLSNAWSLADTVTLTISGRYNAAYITLRDRLGSALDGDHDFNRLNPAIGLTAGLPSDLTMYVGYSESNRAPSPVELTCADEDDPCRLPNAFLADPPLEQVVAATIEAGLRGEWRSGTWQGGVFRTTNRDDILFISAGALTSEGFFDNVGRTRRDGVELMIEGEFREEVRWFANYTWLEATFREQLVFPSPHNLAAVDGEVFVTVGDRLPLIPHQMLKAGIRLPVAGHLVFGANFRAASGFHLRGDEGNDLDTIGGYAVLGLRGDYRVNDNLLLFVTIDNLLDSEYETFGLFGDATEVLGAGFADKRFLSPAAPRAAWLGLRFSL